MNQSRKVVTEVASLFPGVSWYMKTGVIHAPYWNPLETMFFFDLMDLHVLVALQLRVILVVFCLNLRRAQGAGGEARQ